MYLPAPAPGARVLDVGCGNGLHLEMLREWGWVVEGVEPDAQAGEVERSRGITVHKVNLASQCFADGIFDAVTVSHVIEHVYDPVALIRECRRILKPGGILVIITPNISSITYRLFRSSSAHLEPPRHLVLFQPRNLAYLADLAGVQMVRCTTLARGAKQLFLRTLDIRRRGFTDHERQVGLLESLIGWAYHLMERVLVKFHKDGGEEILLIATRKGNAGL